MSLVSLGRTNFLRFCPCLYYNAVSRHVKQSWLSQHDKRMNVFPNQAY